MSRSDLGFFFMWAVTSEQTLNYAYKLWFFLHVCRHVQKENRLSEQTHDISYWASLSEMMLIYAPRLLFLFKRSFILQKRY